MADFSKIRKYWPKYKVSNIAEMIKNNIKNLKSAVNLFLVLL